MDQVKQSEYGKSAAALYLNYFLHGIQTVILAQGMRFFAMRWQVSEADVFGIIAAIGIGKISVMVFSGVLSDFFGRKPFVLLGVLGYLIFFGGLLFCTDPLLAYMLAIVAGGATSFLDGGTYPALLEMFPRLGSAASVLVKLFISLASALVPLAASFLNYYDYSFAWILVVAFVITLVSLLCLIRTPFPSQAEVQNDAASSMAPAASDAADFSATQRVQHAHFWFEGVLCLVFGFLCLATFYLWQQSVTKFALDVVGMGDAAARGLTLVFSVSTILAVVLTTLMMRRGVKDIVILVCYTFMASVGFILAYLFPSANVLYLSSFMIGFFMAGGLLQIGGALLSQFFPARKGLNTSLYNVCFAFATYIMPFMIKSLLEGQQFDQLFLVGVALSGASFIVALMLSISYQRVFGIKGYRQPLE